MATCSERIGQLSLYDIVNSPGVAADIAHCDTKPVVSGHMGEEQLGDALDGADLVLVPAGMPRKPGMTRDDLFQVNAGVARTIAEACSRHCPEAMVGIITNPVNSTVPIVAETLKAAGTYNPRRLFGVTTLDTVRANKFVAESQGWDPATLDVTVIGGHAGTTILPLLSEVEGATWTDEEIATLTHRIQFGGDEVVEAKAGAGSATLSMAFAATRFADKILRAMEGESVELCAFVESSAVPQTPFFASRLTVDAEGVKEFHDFSLSPFEQSMFDSMIDTLAGQIQKGVDFTKA
jgi:malate dehydrogenase